MSSQDEQFPAAAPEPAAPSTDDGMTWWYRWLCRIAGVLGGLCKYPHSLAAKGSPSMPLVHAKVRIRGPASCWGHVCAGGMRHKTLIWGYGFVSALDICSLCFGQVEESWRCLKFGWF